MLGGGMRQAGVVAAAGVVSLTHMIERLDEDHRRARDIAVGLHNIDARFVEPLQVETNILMVDVSHTSGGAHEWVSALAARGIDLRSWSQTQLRLVTHRHIDDSAVARIIAAFSAVHNEMSGR
jgi:threonine aldolase